MLTVLNVSHHDIDLALNLLRWIEELGGCKKHQILLSFSEGVIQTGRQQDLIAAATGSFADVNTFAIPPSGDEQLPWPAGANHAWREVVFYVRQRMRVPFLYLEPDCTPIPNPLYSNWLDAIEAEYEKARQVPTPKQKGAFSTEIGKHFMGAEVTHPSRRVSGVAVYPAKVSAFLRKRILPMLNEPNPTDGKREAWDSFFAGEFVPHTHFTPLIQNVYTGPPTFPDAASLNQLDPESVLFHRCKDGSLIERLREKAVDFTHEITSYNPPIKVTTEPPEAPAVSGILPARIRLDDNGVPRSMTGQMRALCEAAGKLIGGNHSRKQMFHGELRRAGLIREKAKR